MVLTTGFFDPVHPGHFRYLKAAQALGPVLCLIACRRTRVLPPIERRRLLQHAFPDIDFRLSDDVAEVIRVLRPRLLFKGRDWEGRLPQEILDACEAAGTAISFWDDPEGRQSASAWLRGFEDRLADEGLARLERLMREPPASPFTEDDFARSYPSEADRRRLEAVHAQRLIWAFSAKARFLDVGAGRGWLVEALRQVGAQAEGLDPSPARGPSVAFGDFTTLPQGFDVVICREVLEHLSLPQAVQAVRAMMAATRRWVYVTTRHPREALGLLDIRTVDAERQALDPTERLFLPQRFLRVLFVLEGGVRDAQAEALLDFQHASRTVVYAKMP